MNHKINRIAVLFSRLSGYMAACLKTLHDRHQVQLLVIRKAPSSQAPFEDRYFDWIANLYDRDQLSYDQIESLMMDFQPDAILSAGWFDKVYLKIARTMRRKQVPVVAGSDSQWNGSLRQRIGQLTAPWYLQSAIDVMWVAGERQRQLARKLGYTGNRCLSGYYACDWNEFSKVYNGNHQSTVSPAFLFIGRYIKNKGVDVLLDAYRRYREMSDKPWPLICAGTGVFDARIDSQPGVINKGFVQPEAIPSLMKRSGVFVLPSNREPWGVVIQEAAAAGLPLICSEACGAGVHLLQDGYNGYTFETGNADHLASCMLQMSTSTPDRRDLMGDRSHRLSRQFTPERWADTLITGVKRIMET